MDIQLSVLVYYKGDIIFSSKCNLFSPWDGWTITHLALNNDHPHSLIHPLKQQPSTFTHPSTTFISIRVHLLYFLRNISIIYKYTILDHSISETVMNLANDNDNI